MKIGIIDAEIINISKHRFPNLCCEKISAYHKSLGDEVVLLNSYQNLDDFDKVYISRVFTKTQVPDEVLNLPNVEYGGTGFFYDKAPDLPYEVEHAFPDYHLYDTWIENQIKNGRNPNEFKFYTDYSIGYLTRGCFRGCYYCVNRNSKRSQAASPLYEFMDTSRPKLCFLDDNFLACSDWQEALQPVLDSGKKFQFRQGLDERLLTKEKILEMSKWRYDGDITFSFDNIEDKDLIISKLILIRTVAPKWNRTIKNIKFYIFCGADKHNIYDKDFWEQDIINMFERIFILMKFGCIPYVMRFEKVYDTEYSSFYATVAAWCNQPTFFKKKSFREFAYYRGMIGDRKEKRYGWDWRRYAEDGNKKGVAWTTTEEMEQRFPKLKDYYDIRFEEISGSWQNINIYEKSEVV